MKTKLLGVVAALALCGMNPNAFASAITVGTTDAGNCSLGGCLSGSFEYEQIYAASAFTGPITFNQIGFFDLPSSAPNLGAQQPTPNAIFEQGTYTISFATTTAPLGTSFPVGPLENVSTFFTGTLGGPVNANGAYYITGSNFTYDPSVGNLVLMITTTNGTGSCCSYFDDDTSGAFMSRAAYQVGEGTVADLTGLVTDFGTTPLAVPAPLAGTGLPGLIAVCMGLFVLARRRRHEAPHHLVTS